MIRLRIDGDVTGKGRPRFSRKTGHVYTPEKTVSYENLIAWTASREMNGRDLISGPVSVLVHIYVGIPKSKSKAFREQALAGLAWPTVKPDIDNAIKGLMDALNRVVWNDDVQVVALTAQKSYSDRPRMEVSIAQLG